MAKRRLQIRNSTAEFLIFTVQAKEEGIEVRLEGDTIWLSQKLMAVLFDCTTDNIGLHLKNIFREEELEADSVTEEFSVTASDGKNYRVKHYNLDAIIAVGYRINTKRATAFDYDAKSQTTLDFFATVQNKLHFAIHHHTAAELIMARANAAKEHMGLTSWKNAPNGKIIKSDVAVAKNYLTEKELQGLNRVVSMYLDYAEIQAERHIPMTMDDWAKKLNAFLEFNEYDLLHDIGKVSAQVAKAFAESEFEKYRIIQDRLFRSDFDKFYADHFLDSIENDPASETTS